MGSPAVSAGGVVDGARCRTLSPRRCCPVAEDPACPLLCAGWAASAVGVRVAAVVLAALVAGVWNGAVSRRFGYLLPVVLPAEASGHDRLVASVGLAGASGGLGGLPVFPLHSPIGSLGPDISYQSSDRTPSDTGASPLPLTALQRAWAARQLAGSSRSSGWLIQDLTWSTVNDSGCGYDWV